MLPGRENAYGIVILYMPASSLESSLDNLKELYSKFGCTVLGQDKEIVERRVASDLSFPIPAVTLCAVPASLQVKT